MKYEFVGYVGIDGTKFAGPRWFNLKPGSTLWFSVLGLGRFVLSLVPREGVKNTGVISENIVLFEAYGHRDEIRMKLLLWHPEGLGTCMACMIRHTGRMIPGGEWRHKAAG